MWTSVLCMLQERGSNFYFGHQYSQQCFLNNLLILVTPQYEFYLAANFLNFPDLILDSLLFYTIFTLPLLSVLFSLLQLFSKSLSGVTIFSIWVFFLRALVILFFFLYTFQTEVFKFQEKSCSISIVHSLKFFYSATKSTDNPKIGSKNLKSYFITDTGTESQTFTEQNLIFKEIQNRGEDSDISDGWWSLLQFC